MQGAASGGDHKVGVEEAKRCLEAHGRRRLWIENSIRGLKSEISLFGRFLGQEGIDDFRKVTRETMLSFQAWLGETIAPRTGKKYAIRSQCRTLTAVRCAFVALFEAAVVMSDVSQVLRFPKIPRYLPEILTAGDVKKILEQPDLGTVMGSRDRAIVETLYSTLVRASELAAIRVGDLNEEEHRILIRGKGGRERVVPVGRIAWQYLLRYRDGARLLLEMKRREPSVAEERLFLTKMGQPMTGAMVSGAVQRVLDAAGYQDRQGASHLLRYAGATHMIENGADIREVQEILGHRNINTTMGYCLTTAWLLKKTHEKTHPREKGTST